MKIQTNRNANATIPFFNLQNELLTHFENSYEIIKTPYVFF